MNDWEVMKEITNEGEWATLFQTGSEEDCVSKIQEWMDRRLQVPADVVRKQFSIENHIQALNRIYEEALV